MSATKKEIVNITLSASNTTRTGMQTRSLARQIALQSAQNTRRARGRPKKIASNTDVAKKNAKKSSDNSAKKRTRTKAPKNRSANASSESVKVNKPMELSINTYERSDTDTCVDIPESDESDEPVRGRRLTRSSKGRKCEVPVVDTCTSSYTNWVKMHNTNMSLEFAHSATDDNSNDIPDHFRLITFPNY